MIREGVHFGKGGESERRVVRFYELNIDDEIIKKNCLEKALVHAKFFNGVEMFKKEEQKIMIELLRKSYKNMENREKVEELVYYFLERRRTINQRYKGSSL